MSTPNFIDFLKREGASLVGIFVLILLISFLAIYLASYLGFRAVSYSDFANLVIATVAVTSLYIAWRELLRKTKPNVAISFDYTQSDESEEVMALKITNSGANVLTPENSWYGFAERTEDGDYYFSNTEHSSFEEDALNPGDTASVEIGKNIAVLELEVVNIRNYKGEVVNLEEFEVPEQQIRTRNMDSEGRAQVKIQKIFDAVMDIDHGLGVRIRSDEIIENEVDEIIEEHILVDYS